MNDTPKLQSGSRIGIINRGEAAIRFIRAVREYNVLHNLSLSTVAFYMEVEDEALFVKEADRAVPLSRLPGYASVAGSPYLNKALMLDALTGSDCDAVWVGWGFVSEDSEFVRMVEQAGLVFLGPTSASMALLGDKIEAKELADRNGVPILPWSRGPVTSLDHAREMAEKIGYPCIVKAAHAGGGRGIRFVRTPGELESQFRSAREETVRITGGDIVFMEHLVERGRHLEVQCLADTHGNVHTFGVRDCSVQRRNQKIIEETPPPHLDRAHIQEIEASASRLITAAGYHSAGTVEFLFDMDQDRYFFMEVNTRLQVEHPITEQLYTVDLVHGQLDVAFGKALSIERTEPTGSVIEIRLNAEDPDREFTPSPGRVTRYTTPAGPGIRVDSGIERGSVIPTEFDSMIAKIIAYGSSRAVAMARLQRALRELRIRIEGGTTNRAFVLDLLDSPEVRTGGVSTQFVEQFISRRSRNEDPRRRPVALMSCAIEQYRTAYRAELLNFRQQLSTSGYPRETSISRGFDATLTVQGNKYDFTVTSVGDNSYHVRHEDLVEIVQYLERESESLYVVGDERHRIQIVDRGDALQCEVDGIPFMIEVESGGAVKAPSPSIVLSVAVEEGMHVTKGELLLSLEAMKMEMVVQAPETGTVKQVLVRKGEQVAAGQPLVQLEMRTDDRDEDAESVEPAPRIVFPDRENIPGRTWRLLSDEYLSVFLGYDHRKDVGSLLTEMTAFVEKNPEFRKDMVRVFVEGVELLPTIEILFDTAPVETEGFARPLSNQELLVHYFRRTVDREKGLPRRFLDRLERALRWYPLIDASEDDRYTGALLRMYKSHADRATKQELLHGALFALEQHADQNSIPRSLADTLDQIAYLAQTDTPNLADAAIHARYRFIDRLILDAMREEKRDTVERTLNLLTRRDANGRTNERLVDNVVNTGHAVLPDLVEAITNGDPETREIALQMLARRFHRDRFFLGFEIIPSEDCIACRLEVADDQATLNSVLGVVSDRELTEGYRSFLGTVSASPGAEAILLYSTSQPELDIDDLVRQVSGPDWAPNSSPAFLVLAVLYPDRRVRYRTLSFDQSGHWGPEIERGPFGPLSYRELRVFRAARFERKVLYEGDSAYLLLLKAIENPRDERLFAFVQVPSARIELDKNGAIHRMVALENVFMEAVYAMRAEQARRKHRLYWNRIVIHIRTVLHATLKQIQEYAGKLAIRTTDLGIEKLVIYSRRMNSAGTGVEEVELLFENISGASFTLRGRAPSSEPLAPMDANVAKIVRARQRNALYPYEILKLITRTGYPVKETYPRGDFEEYDIEIAADGSQSAVSVKGRESGENIGNVVFGIITNYLPSHPEGFRRVIILSDPTGDMGSLAEQECRRINAALDLAEQHGFPVEWLPVSAGARIDMESGTENLDWTACTLRRIVEFTQNGGEINIIVSGINVGAQSYWNAEATMLMHTRGILIMTEDASMLLTGKKALDFSGSVSAENNVGIGGVERIMGPNGQSQFRVKNLYDAYSVLFRHYSLTYAEPGTRFPKRLDTSDPDDRDVCSYPYNDTLGQGFKSIGDIFSPELNPERKKPFEMRQMMSAVKDQDSFHLERWAEMKDAETAIVWETRTGGYAVGMIGIESRSLARLGEIPHDGPESWSGGTLFPVSSKKVARAVNAFSGRLPAVILANLSGFDGSPESLRKLQLEFGAEIGRAVVNFEGPIVFVVTARYHGGAYVVFSKTLNSQFHSVALEGAYASVIGGAPAAAVVFPRLVLKDTYADPRILEAQQKLKTDRSLTEMQFDELFQKVHAEKQSELALNFDRIHSVERAKNVGSIDEIIPAARMRPYIIERVRIGMDVHGR